MLKQHRLHKRKVQNCFHLYLFFGICGGDKVVLVYKTGPVLFVGDDEVENLLTACGVNIVVIIVVVL